MHDHENLAYHLTGDAAMRERAWYKADLCVRIEGGCLHIIAITNLWLYFLKAMQTLHH